MEQGGKVKCNKCRHYVSISNFSRKPKSESFFKACNPCREKAAESLAKWKGSEKGMKWTSDYMKSDAKKASGSRSFKVFRNTEAGKAHAKRGSVRRSAKISKSPELKHRHWMNALACRLVNGFLKSSPTFVAATGFASVSELKRVLEDSFSENMSFSNYGSLWTMEHRIPQAAYDFSDPEDVKRCWAPGNLRAAPRTTNSQKSWKISDDECLTAGQSCYPKSWKGAIPSEEEKAILHDRFRTGMHA
jgi:hypothetical protein